METKMKKVKDLEAGEFCTLRENSKQVFVMGSLRAWSWVRDYDYSNKGYWVTSLDDISKCKCLKGEKVVFLADC